MHLPSVSERVQEFQNFVTLHVCVICETFLKREGHKESTGKSLLELPKTRTTLMRRNEKLSFLNFRKRQTYDDLEQFFFLGKRDATRTVSTDLYARTIVVNKKSHTHTHTHT